jgi:hypothetical protein
MRNVLIAAIAAAALAALPAQAGAKKENKGVASTAGVIVFYDGLNYGGQAFGVDSKRMEIDVGFNIKSIGIHEGEKWRICAKSRLREPCLVLTGSVPDASTLGIYGGIGSLEPIDD